MEGQGILLRMAGGVDPCMEGKLCPLSIEGDFRACRDSAWTGASANQTVGLSGEELVLPLSSRRGELGTVKTSDTGVL